MTRPEDIEQAFQATTNQLRFQLEAYKRFKLEGIGENISPFNNFHAKLPGGSTRTTLGQKYADIHFSDKSLKGKTLREFWGDIDRIAMEEGIPIEEIQRLQNIMTHTYDSAGNITDHQGWQDAYIGLAELTIPIYARLLLEGYTRNDIIG